MKIKELQIALLLVTIYQQLKELTTTVLDDNCSITLFNNDSGYFDISYKDRSIWKQLVL